MLPGLHDHHLHLLSLAASLDSIACRPGDTEERIAQRLRSAAENAGAMLRVTSYHESMAGEIDRVWLDGVLPDVPVRVQHRSGRLWIFNSAALEILRRNTADLSPLERDGEKLTGRLYDGDGWLRKALSSTRPSLARASALLASFGVTGVSDATAGNDRAQFQYFGRALEAGELLQDLRVMGDASLEDVEARGDLSVGAVKFHLHDGALPSAQDLGREFAAAHEAGRGVAIHCVTLSELALTLAALRDVGSIPDDRIEHMSICPPDFYPLLADLGVTVVTNANFVAERGDDYLRDVAVNERGWLYPCRTVERAGIAIAAGTDAPFGIANPWPAMQAAVDRKTASGAVLGDEERLSPERALALFLAPLDNPGGPTRHIRPGVVADLCLLDRPWAEMRRDLRACRVVLTLRKGAQIWRL